MRQRIAESNCRTVLITGASSGIGKACAVHLARRGHLVYGTSRDPASAGTLDDVRLLKMDVDDDASVAAAFACMREHGAKLNVLVNNAGFGIAGAVEDTSVEEARALVETNLLGVLRMCRMALPEMRARGRGTIVNITSLAGRVGLPFQGTYSATKFALEGFSQALRMEVRPFGVRVIVIAPGDFRTAFTARRQIAAAAGEASAYHTAFRRALHCAQEDEQGGPPPDQVARLVQRIVEGRARCDAYSVGTLTQRMAVAARPLIPWRLYERAVMRHYGI